jgi:DNA-binding transcriptional ArsR family regulator
MIVARGRDLTPSDRAQEGTLNSKDRVLAALEDGPAYPDEVVEATGLSRSTVKNAITTLKKIGRVEVTGEAQGQMEQVRLVAAVALPIKGKAAKATSENTVAALLREPPQWLSGQVAVYRKDPERHLAALTHAIAHHLGQAPGKTRYEIRKFFEAA